MTRALSFLVRNWPLKLGAIVLATLLYAGLVLSQNTRPFDGRIPIEATGQPRGIVVLSDLGSVRSIRYFAPENLGIPLDTSSFRATVDLTNVDPAAGTVTVPVRVEASDPRVSVLEYEPNQIKVRLDAVIERSVDIRVDRGVVPAGLDVRQAVLSVTSASVRGPASIVDRVAELIARVRIDPSGIDIDRDIELLPVDELGEQLSPVDVSPASVRVRIAVFTNRQTRALPVHPIVTGTPAAGFEIASVTIDPLVVTVEGDGEQLVSLDKVDTTPISVSNASSDITTEVDLALPTGVLPLAEGSVKVTIALRPVTATRTFSAGIALVGARSDRTYSTAADRILVTLGGSIADLDRLTGSTFTVTLDVTGLDLGDHDVAVGANLAAGLTLVAASPATVTVTISGPSPSATPISPPPSASPTP